jgi:glucokinase
MPNFSIGVDLGGTNLRIAAVDEAGHLLEKVTLGARVKMGREHILYEMCTAIQHLSGKYQTGGSLTGIGVGIPGIIDLAHGLVRESPNLMGWSDYPVRDEIERRLGARVTLENDANCAALGEKWLGAAREVDDMAILTLGTGVGGGIVMGGRIWHGMNGMAGEFGHMTVDPNGPQCLCGNRGCVEQYSSASGIMRMTREAIAAGHAPALAKAATSDPEFSAKAVYNLAIQGDEEARKILEAAGRALGTLIGGLVNALNLAMYVVGGGVSAAWEAFSPAMFEELVRRSMVYAATAPPSRAGDEGASAQVESKTSRKTIVTRALLGGDAGLYGAARIPLLDSHARR